MGMTTEQIEAVVKVLRNYAESLEEIRDEISQSQMASSHEAVWFDGVAHGMKSTAKALETTWLRANSDVQADPEPDQGVADCTPCATKHPTEGCADTARPPDPRVWGGLREQVYHPLRLAWALIHSVTKEHTHAWVTVGYGGCGWYLLKCPCGERSIG